ncbi:zinc finger BED domain-containing protein 4 [Bombyx mori]|uniref:BED-type domain-containing protein n=1 Tax=Bombyx mori TaxID=7091 RepID=A0A8R2DLN6_BOMMO|nr:zinc finger BED domain-containing protein 4 [Bombyx mori]
MARTNSSVLWEFFDKSNVVDKKAKCRVCGCLYSYKGTTGNLKAHLKKRHLDAYLSLTSGQQEIRTQNIADTTPSVPHVTITSTIISTTATSTGAAVCPSGSHVSAVATSQQIRQQQQIESCNTAKQISGELKRKIDSDLLDLFVDSYQPFTLVEERSFKKFVRWIPGYQLPTRKTISNVMIPTLFNKTKETLKTELLQIENICLTADLWTSRANESYLAVTGHFITDDYELKTCLLDCSNFQESHTNDNIQTVLIVMVKEWNLTNKINFVITDNAANIQRAISNIGWKHYGCYGHTLNLIVQNAISNDETLQNLLEKVKKIVRFFKSSSTALEQLLKAQTNDQPNCIPKRLIQEVPTCWNSTFQMVRRFVDLEQCLRSTVAILKKDLPIITNDEWLLLAEIAKILKPFHEATESMSGEKYMTASSVIVMTRCLTTACDKLLIEDYCELSKEIIYKLRSGLVMRFTNVERSETFSVCTFLDPRYKLAVFSDENEAKNTKKRVQDLLMGIILQENQESAQDQVHASISEHHEADKFSPWAILSEIVGQKQTVGTPLSKAIKEIDTYLKDDVLPVFKGTTWSCPLEWWRKHKFTYPNLAKLFKRYGNIMATSVQCERIFSKTGWIINDRRTRLSSSKVKQLTFLNVNLCTKRFEL